MPTLDPKLTETERLAPIEGKPSGKLVLIDLGVLTELYHRAAEYAGAVWRLNDHIGGIKQERGCTKARLETGTAPAECPQQQ